MKLKTDIVAFVYHRQYQYMCHNFFFEKKKWIKIMFKENRKKVEVQYISWWHVDLSKIKTSYLVHLINTSFVIVSTYVRISSSAKISDMYRGLEKNEMQETEIFWNFTKISSARNIDHSNLCYFDLSESIEIHQRGVRRGHRTSKSTPLIATFGWVEGSAMGEELPILSTHRIARIDDSKYPSSGSLG